MIRYHALRLLPAVGCRQLTQDFLKLQSLHLNPNELLTSTHNDGWYKLTAPASQSVFPVAVTFHSRGASWSFIHVRSSASSEQLVRIMVRNDPGSLVALDTPRTKYPQSPQSG